MTRVRGGPGRRVFQSTFQRGRHGCGRAAGLLIRHGVGDQCSDAGKGCDRNNGFGVVGFVARVRSGDGAKADVVDARTVLAAVGWVHTGLRGWRVCVHRKEGHAHAHFVEPWKLYEVVDGIGHGAPLAVVLHGAGAIQHDMKVDWDELAAEGFRSATWGTSAAR